MSLFSRKRSRHTPTLVLGSGARARDIARRWEKNGAGNIIGFLDDDPEPQDLEKLGSLYLGEIATLSHVANRHGVHQVLFGLPRRFLADDAISNALAVCDLLGIGLTIPADLFDGRAATPRATRWPFPSVTFSSRVHHAAWKLAIKRVLDILVSAAGILALLPIWLIVMIAVKFTSDGPAFFRQNRVGLHGELFPMLKFRTMYVDAEERLAALAHSNEQRGPVFKMKNDPRITPIGRWLRKLSIDEAPQLWNVLVGQMSLVGPRPPLSGEVDQYEVDHRVRLSMRPGLTCLWQVSGRNEIPFEDWVKLDIEYIENWSLTLDLEILAATVPAVLFARGAS